MAYFHEKVRQSMWHVAGTVGGLLTWVMWYLAHSWRIQMVNRPDANEERKSLRNLQALLWIRAALVTYTAFCGLIAIFKTLQWVSLDVRWLP